MAEPTGTLSTVGDVSGPAADAAKSAQQQPKGAEEWFEILLDGQEEPTKIPLQKLKGDAKLLEKLRPDIAKRQAAADKRWAEADKRDKSFAAREQVVAQVEQTIARIKENPKAFRQLAKDLNVPPEELATWHEEEFTPKLVRMIEDADAQQKGKEAQKALEQKREIERLLKAEEETKAKEEEREASETAKAEENDYKLLSNWLKSGLDLVENPGLKWLVAREAIPIVEYCHEHNINIRVDHLIRECLKRIDSNHSVVRKAALSEDELKQAEAELAKRKAKPQVAHPAVQGHNRTTPKPKPSDNKSDAPEGHVPAALSIFQKITRPENAR